MKKSSERITYLYGIYNGTRMLIGAINALFLLKRGVGLGDIAFLQMIYKGTVFLMEIPTGVVADVISRKLSVILSCILLCIYYPIVCIGTPNMIILSIAQILYALALCLVSGAFEGWQAFIVKSEYPDNPDKLNYYGHMKYEINSFVTMFSGTFGTLIIYFGRDQYNILYFLCTILMLYLTLAFSKMPYKVKKIEKAERTKMKNAIVFYIDELRQGVKSCFFNINGWCYFMGMSFLVCTYQVVFYYWQPYFSILARNGRQGYWLVNSEEVLMGVVFFVYSFSRFLMNRIARKRLVQKINPFIVAIVSLCIAIFSMINFTIVGKLNIYIYIILFAIIQGTVTLVESILESQFIKKTQGEYISSNLSITSAATSVLSIGVLYFISKTINENNMNIFFACTIIMYLLTIVVLVTWCKNYNKN